jgi:mRNA interferase YafQ
MLAFAFSTQFKKDIKLMEKRRRNIDKIFEIISLLIWEEPLPEYCREHKLHGNLEGFWDCHIEGDWVLLYELDEGKKINFAFTGTHSDLL